MTPKLVSIIIPAWNAKDYIREAVDSALNQTYPDIEVIVVNDGSTDNTEEILKTYFPNPKFRYFKHENFGLAYTRNTGLKNANGGFIAFLDSDDIFLPEKIEHQVKALENNPDFDFSYCDLLHFTDTHPREFFHHRYAYPSGDLFAELLKKQFINPLTVVARKSIFDRYGLFSDQLHRSEDWELWLRFARAGVKFLHVDQILAHYRVRGVGNLSSIESEPEMKEKNLEIFLNLKDQLTPAEAEKYHFPSIIKNLKTKLALAYLMVGNKTLALKNTPSNFQRLFISLLPSKIWKIILGFVRRVKHRSLLQKVNL
ncbi:MAG: glycosyltransferase [Patescibacteria group bacterium]